MPRLRAALALLMSCPAAIATAADTSYTVVVQDYAALPPYSRYENGEYTGFNRDLLDLFAESRVYESTSRESSEVVVTTSERSLPPSSTIS